MIDRLFSEDAFVVVEKALDAGALRQEVVANNLANVNTPGFKKSRVSFEEQLQDILATRSVPLNTTDSKHFSAGPSSVASLSPQAEVVDGILTGDTANDVDIDEEMAGLAKNNISFNTLAHIFSVKFRMLNSAIGGKGGTA